MAQNNDKHASTETRGIRYAAEVLRVEDFPMGRHEIDYSVGDIEIENGDGEWIAIRELTDALGETQFTSAELVIRALREQLAQKRKHAA
jgi:hypothetical protein